MIRLMEKIEKLPTYAKTLGIDAPPASGKIICLETPKRSPGRQLMNS